MSDDAQTERNADRAGEGVAEGEMSKTATVADLINQYHNKAYTNAREACVIACDCGDLLREQKAEIEHGSWEKWVEDNCHFSMRTARNYIKASKAREENGGNLPFASLRGLYGPTPDVPEKVSKDDAARDVRPTPTQLDADVLNVNNGLEEIQLPLMSAASFVSEAGTEILTEAAQEKLDYLVQLFDMINSAKGES